MKCCFLVVVGILFPLCAVAQYEVSVTEITVWVRVVDSSGNPIKGLTKQDFEIFEDGKAQSLTCFQERDIDPEEESLTAEDNVEVKAGIPSRRFVLFLDLLNTSPSEYLRVRPKLEEFLSQIEGKKWEVMLAALTEKGKLGVIAPFTSDFSILRTLLSKAPANGKRDAHEKNNLRDITLLLKKAKENPQMRASIVQTAFSVARTFARDEERNSELSIAALESFAAHLLQKRPSEEHTIILYVSGGFHADPGRRYFETINYFLEKETGTLSSAEFRDTNFDVRRLVKNSVGKLNRMNMTLYTINTRGMYDGGDNMDAADPSFAQFSNTFLQDYQESLAQIADETGGAFFKNSQNFKKGFDLILTDLSHQYELCYRPSGEKKSGKYHKIEVRTKRDGARIRHRKGYWD
jgi:VWFA-related protein